MGKGAIAIGIVCILAGLYWVYKVITSPDAPLWLLIHLSILIGVGIALIIFFKEENKIEQRKDIKNKEDK
tara:strand:+ start:3111 stop:3320 length:210 start_codon:yes stop_codon:yes gene_type:complete